MGDGCSCRDLRDGGGRSGCAAQSPGQVSSAIALRESDRSDCPIFIFSQVPFTFKSGGGQVVSALVPLTGQG